MRITRDGDRPSRLTVSGHAGSGPYGQDIVCAAVSALVETLGLGLRSVCSIADGIAIGPGTADFQFPAAMDEPTRAVVETMLAGLQDLSRSHASFVQWNEYHT